MWSVENCVLDIRWLDVNGSFQIDGLAEAMTEEYQYRSGRKEDRIH